METKINELIVTTSDFSEMRGKFLAEKLLRKWEEEFIDEDSAEVVKVERNELIFEKGTELGEAELSVINFHLQSNDIKEVTVSNQQRTGVLTKRMPSVWLVTANYSNKKYNLYLYSNSIDMAQKIATDFLEQKVQGLFSFVAVKEFDMSTLIPANFGKSEKEVEEDFEADYYKLEVSIINDDLETTNTFIVKGSDAEKAKEIVVKYLEFSKKENENKSETTVTILSAKTISCDYVVEYEFSKEYFDNEEQC